MRVDSKGIWWNDTDYKTEKKETLLIEEGWVQVASGFWAEEYALENADNVNDVCEYLDVAYKIARANKTGEKRFPPEPVWLAADYLPGLEEANAFNVPLFTDGELIEMADDYYYKGVKHTLVFDIECYGNFFFIAFISPLHGKVALFELSDDAQLDHMKLSWMFSTFTVIGFNSNNYDIHIAALAIEGCSTASMKSATSEIIEEGARGWEVLRRHKAKKLQCDHIDLIEVAPLFASLKIYGGRMHAERMQDLPFAPNTVLSAPQRQIVRWYCINDLRTTIALWQKIIKEIELREDMGRQYGVDLRSKSDAQIAEAVLGAEIQKLNGYRPAKPTIAAGTAYRYRLPAFIQYVTPLMQSVLYTVLHADFVVSEYGNIGLPQELKELSITMNQSTYKMGIGGLHSTEKKAAHYAGPGVILKDVDVVSYYPYIILNLGLYPQQLGPAFLNVFRTIVERRVAAKRAGNKTVADSLKIVVNGSFGKLGSMYSILYSPDLLIQVTVTGQLALLMLIERLELAGVPVVSANTDGIVIKCPVRLEAVMEGIVKQWEIDTGFETEESVYKALYSRDVNNYMAIKHESSWKPDEDVDDRVKTKGIFATPGLSKNPQNEICIRAIKEYLINGIPVPETIHACRDIRKFLNVRTVKGGAVKLYGEGKPGLYLGKAIRWYYGKDVPGEIVYAKSGNRVPKSQGAQPLMDLPEAFPDDVDYDWYEREAFTILKQVDHQL